jgi:hypothetical protein
MGIDRATAGEPVPPGGSLPDSQLSERLAELRQRLGESAPAGTPAAAPAEETAPTAEATPATETAAAAPAPAEPPAAPAEPPAPVSEATKPAPEATPEPAAPAPAGSDTSTAIVVKGLGSFGAITSFKQALERVEGVRGVTLSLGPTGEFVYRASHGADFDLAAAIRTIEGDAANIERSDGSLLVTVSRAR